MPRTLVAIILAAVACSGCSKPSLSQSLADCKVQAQRTVGPAIDADPYIADCMDGRGYRIRADCTKVDGPARLERCYEPKAR